MQLDMVRQKMLANCLHFTETKTKATEPVQKRSFISLIIHQGTSFVPVDYFEKKGKNYKIRIITMILS